MRFNRFTFYWSYRFENVKTSRQSKVFISEKLFGKIRLWKLVDCENLSVKSFRQCNIFVSDWATVWPQTQYSVTCSHFAPSPSASTCAAFTSTDIICSYGPCSPRRSSTKCRIRFLFMLWSELSSASGGLGGFSVGLFELGYEVLNWVCLINN